MGGGVRCPRCTGGRRRAAGAELGANTGCPQRGERRTAVWGAGHPRAHKSDRAGTGGGRRKARGCCPSPHTSKHPPYQPHLWLQPPPPAPALSSPSLDPRALAGAGLGKPGSDTGRSRDAAGPGAAYLGPWYRERRQPVARSREPGAAPPRFGVLRFSRTLSRARSCEKGPGCSHGSVRRLRRRCRRQRTPRGGWKPVWVAAPERVGSAERRWRLRDSGLAHARLQVGVCVGARAPTGWGSREGRGREAEMLVGTEAKFFTPGNPSTWEERWTERLA